MEADVLSDLLRAVRLRGAIYFDFNLSAPWVAAAPESSRAAAILMPHADHLIEFHVVARGQCWARRLGGEPMLLSEGDAIVYPHGDPHVMASSLDLNSVSSIDFAPGLELLKRARAVEQLPLVIEAQPGKPAEVSFVCGFLGCDLRPFNPLIAALPREIHIRRSGARDDDWLGAFLSVTVGEARARRAGGQNMLARMSELMFVELIRRHLESLPDEQTGWLAGLRDRQVGKALSLIHRQAARAWTVADLAEAVALSRSAFAERFARLVGMSPMQYLTSWRMQLASELLVGSSQTIAAIAPQAGYESEAAFSRAFRRMTGLPPASWRRDRSAPAETASATRGASFPRDSESAMGDLQT